MEVTRIPTAAGIMLRISGRLDGDWANHLQHNLAETIREGHHHIRLELSDVGFMSSAGISVLMKFYKRLQRIDGLTHRHPALTASEDGVRNWWLSESQPRHHLQQSLARQTELASGTRAPAAGARERELDEATFELITRFSKTSGGRRYGTSDDWRKQARLHRPTSWGGDSDTRQHVLQLAHIAGPVVTRERRQYTV